MGEMVLNSIDNISVVDVYDIATTIGSELERIIDTHGVDSVTTLLPKVVGALELLEAMAGKNEQENILVQELNDRIAKLECDKKEKAAFRERSQKELEAIEEEWKTETNELLTLVNKLQEENSALKKTFGIKTDAIQNDTAESISRNVKQSLNIVGTSTENLNDLVVDMQLLQRQRNLLEKQRDKIKQIENKLQEQQSDNENLSIQIERLQGTNRDTKKRQKVLQLQIRTLVEERADFLAQLQDQHREIINLKKQLGVAEKENEDLTSFEHEDDPHRPRYTTAELKEIFAERDDLKTQVLELHEQLNFYKPVDLNVPDELEAAEEDPPVQGPLPYEPEDAPWKKSNESGIRKFFRKLFAEPGSTSLPQRSLSTLSKMALSASTNSDGPI